MRLSVSFLSVNFKCYRKWWFVGCCFFLIHFFFLTEFTFIPLHTTMNLVLSYLKFPYSGFKFKINQLISLPKFCILVLSRIGLHCKIQGYLQGGKTAQYWIYLFAELVLELLFITCSFSPFLPLLKVMLLLPFFT